MTTRLTLAFATAALSSMIAAAGYPLAWGAFAVAGGALLWAVVSAET